MSPSNLSKQRYFHLLRSRTWSNDKVSQSLGSTTVSVVICTLNEVENLSFVLPKIPSFVNEIIIVDGHSTDGTPELAKKLKPEVKIFQQTGKGKGSALRDGFVHATGDIIVTLDADGSTDPDDLSDYIIPLLNGFDFVKGSRFLCAEPNLAILRQFGNRSFALLTNMLFGTRYTDLCSGYYSFWKKSLVDALKPSKGDFLDEPTLNIRIKRAALRVVEVPHIDPGRINGKGKNHTLKQGSRILRIIFKERFFGPSFSNNKRVSI
jgi:glycosyltransferase involved in cell wall biosynthesis